MKKNTFKKLMSAIVSVAMLCSMMIIPANAIVPGEDAYGGESTIVRYDHQTGIEEPLDISNINLHPGTTTYDFLSQDELAQVEYEVEREIEARAIIGDDDRTIVTPTNSPFTGIVLVITLLDSNGDNVADNFIPGTGFMVSERVMITARHCVFHASDDILEIRVYQGVSTAHTYDGIDIMTMLDCLDSYSYDTLDTSIYDTSYTGTAADSSEDQYDWCIVILNTGFDCYYFNCAPAPNTLTNTYVTVTGYPSFNERTNNWEGFFMRTAVGLCGIFLNDVGIFAHQADAITGQSGAPVYTNSVQSRICYGIHIKGIDSSEYNHNFAKPITDTLYNLIVDAIENM